MFKEVRDRLTQVEADPAVIPSKMRRSTLAGSLLNTGVGINLAVRGSIGAEDRLSELRKLYKSMYDS